jgi:hypothetical protein
MGFCKNGDKISGLLKSENVTAEYLSALEE